MQTYINLHKTCNLYFTVLSTRIYKYIINNHWENILELWASISVWAPPLVKSTMSSEWSDFMNTTALKELISAKYSDAFATLRNQFSKSYWHWLYAQIVILSLLMNLQFFKSFLTFCLHWNKIATYLLTAAWWIMVKYTTFADAYRWNGS